MHAGIRRALEFAGMSCAGTQRSHYRSVEQKKNTIIIIYKFHSVKNNEPESYEAVRYYTIKRVTSGR